MRQVGRLRDITTDIMLGLKRALGFIPPKFARFHGRFHGKTFNMLDVGCGNHSASLAKKWFPQCNYQGVDRCVYSNSDADFRLMEKYYEIDLSTQSLDPVPDSHFDVVVFNHVIEHLHNGEEVLRALAGKLKQGGVIYVEFPSVRTLRVPHMKGTLHFCDDPTHVKLYDAKEVANTLLSLGFTVIKAGRKRTWWKMATLPLYALYAVFAGRHVDLIWEVCGLAEYVYAEKPASAKCSGT